MKAEGLLLPDLDYLRPLLTSGPPLIHPALHYPSDPVPAGAGTVLFSPSALASELASLP
jgi:hypothetical protein